MKDRLTSWKHVFKLDPDRNITDEALRRVCLSGSDAVIIGGSEGVTFANTEALLNRIQAYPIAKALEVSEIEAIVPGFDLYLIPVVLNSSHPDWIVRRHQQALRKYGAQMPWDIIAVEGYIVCNEQSAVGTMTGANNPRTDEDAVAYAVLAEQIFHLPIVYLEYSGVFGNMERVRKVRESLTNARLFYGGGIDSREKAKQALEAAHTIVVGNAVYDNLEQALQTVEAVK